MGDTGLYMSCEKEREITDNGISPITSHIHGRTILSAFAYQSYYIGECIVWNQFPIYKLFCGAVCSSVYEKSRV